MGNEKTPLDPTQDPGCTPGYYNAEGQSAKQNPLNKNYPKGPKHYFEFLSKLRSEGNELLGFQTGSRRNSRTPGMVEMKVTAKKSAGFYIRAAKSFLNGVDDKE